MKRFLIGAAVVAICLLGLRYAVYYGGFYLDLHPEASIEVNVRTDGKNILVRNEKGEFEKFIVRGVDLPSSIAGHFATDYAVDEDTWLRWFGMIQDMGANTVRAYTIYDDSFYNAFYEFNKNNNTPLYLLQGLQVSDYANSSGNDAYGAEFYAALKEDSIDIIDVLHGRKNIFLNRMKGSGIYRKDVSDWVLGYVVGNEWEPGTIAYTDNNAKRPSSYSGTYFQTVDDSTVFEAMLAKIMDEMVIYESSKYKVQKLMSFQNDPENDPFVYEPLYARQLGKFSHVNAEHLIPTEQLKSGYFAAYRLFEFCPDFSEYLVQDQDPGFKAMLDGLDKETYCQGYTQLLSEYHTMPVVITSYGFSSSRGTDTEKGPLTEKEQGRRLAEVYNEIVESGCSGALIASWQDEWGRRTWNTSYAVDIQNTDLWHDIQTDGQGYGLLSFEPGETESICCVDGDIAEWTEEDRVLEQDGISLSAKYDERCLYLLIGQEGLSRDSELYIPLDITTKSGSMKSDSHGLKFERGADFLLCIHGEDKSRLLVQARYESLRENYQLQITGEDPFVYFPDTDADSFLPIRMILQNHKLVAEDVSDDELLASKRYDTFETGRLVYGNGNPSDSTYNSLADFCYGENIVEVRLPWALLNFSNPSVMAVHDDYYENYGVEWFRIKEIWLGAGTAGQKEPIAMEALRLKGWGDKPVFHERLKQSYDIVKESWEK
ncbi:hypothetical protein [Murimonas intestini]|uniref:Glycoside hydrolase family 42 N-terminal domain-containing protein n=1 Tax=Murimonas intestini TaxID=1337051 RepID=A0AB73TA28_9FIRM|nr:hypothetical protein [Murimonas intestini]MCR1839174.1 hypothetical protein [Murimonas intestini]MCR1864470.1 hypothetical protein [Murimonas intestini]MCR1882080.1 hypothetical protein [Murimonas intestini]